MVALGAGNVWIIRDILPIAGYISKTVQDTHIVTMES